MSATFGWTFPILNNGALGVGAAAFGVGLASLGDSAGAALIRTAAPVDDPAGSALEQPPIANANTPHATVLIMCILRVNFLVSVRENRWI
jgi:hypothetical protein